MYGSLGGISCSVIRGLVHHIHALGGGRGPSAQPVPSRSLGPLAPYHLPATGGRGSCHATVLTSREPAEQHSPVGVH